MTHLLLLILSSLLSGNFHLTTKTLVKSFAYENEQQIGLDLPGTLAVEEWDRNYIRVQIHITIPDHQDRFLKTLIIGGRYSIRAVRADQVLRLSIPKSKFTISDYPIEDELSFTVQVPHAVPVVNLQEAQSDTISCNLYPSPYLSGSSG